jgi:hypothetical protein
MTKTLAALAMTLAAAFALGAFGLPGWMLDAALAQWGTPELLVPYVS